MNEMTVPRRTWSPKEKLEVLLEAVAGGNVAEVCRRRGISENMYYEWRHRLFAKADLVFGLTHPNHNRASTQIAKLEEQLRKKDSVIAEITQENLELKRGPWR